ncbi:MAG: D-alanyl-D-alanine carboxypeptidase/D-alanyl-D-alanine endopeptidase [Candidatus Kryptoniota bacterium]
MKSTLVIAIAFAVGFTGLSSAQEMQALKALQFDLKSIISDSAFSNAFIGIEVKDLRSDAVLFAYNQDKDFVPASNMKLLTTSAALSVLGENYQYHTYLMANGYVLDDTLFGDLYIVGSGDPTISGRFTNGDVVKIFKGWADTLKLLNVKVVKGNVIGDDRVFDNVPVGEGWGLAWHEDVYWYAAYISGLSFNDNCIDVTLKPNKPGAPVLYTLTPPTSYITIINESKTTEDTINTIDFYRDPATNVIHIYGNYPRTLDSMKVSLTVYNPTLYTATVLFETLNSVGIKMLGEPFDISRYQKISRVPPYNLMWTIASYTSPPLSEIVKVINKRSQNFYAEQVFRTLGKEKYGIGTFENARRVEMFFLHSIGVDTTQIEINDGSGLSSWDLVTPHAIVEILEAMRKSPVSNIFYDSLPVAGVDGTLEFRMKGTRAQGNVHGKTGFIENVRSLSGYLTTLDGEPLAFSIFVNHYTVPTSAVNALQDMICTRLCNFSFK